MSFTTSLPVLFAQTGAPQGPGRFLSTLLWFYVYGEPSFTVNGFWGGPLTWIKVVGLFCLLAWVGGWAITAIKERIGKPAHWLDVVALVAILGGLGSMLMQVLESTKRIAAMPVAGLNLSALLGMIAALVMFLWVERLVWSSVLRLGRTTDRFILGGMHLALLVGLAVGFVLSRVTVGTINWQVAVLEGTRLGATYMGFVVLAGVAWLMFQELVAVRWRRLYAIAWLTVKEAMRRMWAPYVVITVFLVILAFTDWFLYPEQDRAAELGRLYVGTLALLCSLLLTVMVAILTPLSLPHDIQNQTIYTVVSKPVRRIELVWGRILGFMFIVTVLLGVFGSICLLYLWRTVGGAIAKTEAEARVLAEKKIRPERLRQLEEEADQLKNRMQARVPVHGSLIFIDSRGKRQIRGIDVGQELELRSHIEGATQATAIWEFGMVPDPVDLRTQELQPKHRVHLIDRVVPVDKFLRRGTLEEVLNRIAELGGEEAVIENRRKDPNLAASEGNRLATELAQKQEQRRRLTAEYEQLKAHASKVDEQLRAARASDGGDLASLRRQAAALHSPRVPIEMTFTVYRTTKGEVGKPVFATIKVINPRTKEDYNEVFPIREYYTNKIMVPASVLAGSHGELRVEVKCLTVNQYLGMAESDLFLLAESGTFGWNFWKGLAGIWLQALVLTAIGVFAGTFLSWPVALLTTIAFFVAGQVAFGALQEFALSTLQGGGPFESFIRLVSHENLQQELTPTLAVVSAKTLDSVVMPIMSRLVYVVPNFGALDVSNTVADGFAVTESLIIGRAFLALAYALPFSIAGYFVLKHREVAA
jgi:hypothetical protein